MPDDVYGPRRFDDSLLRSQKVVPVLRMSLLLYMATLRRKTKKKKWQTRL